MIMFDYAAVPTATTTPASFNITTVVTAVISVVALLKLTDTVLTTKTYSSTIVACLHG